MYTHIIIFIYTKQRMYQKQSSPARGRHTVSSSRSLKGRKQERSSHKRDREKERKRDRGQDRHGWR